MAKVELKQAIVQEISEMINGAQSVVVVDYRGLTVAEDTQLRKQLREAGVSYKVYKNTLVNRAVEGTEFESLRDSLEGPNAFAVSTEDATAPARVLAEFAKKNDKLELKSGFMDGAVMSLDEVKTLAATPNMETLIAKMMGSLNAPISGLVRLLNTVVEGGEEIPELIAKKAASAEEAPAEEAPAAE